MPVDDVSVDYCFANMSQHHVERPPRAIREMVRILKPDGRIVITDLHNLASPLIRYDIGDYAQVGEPCSCGRGLMKLDRILGRQRNLIVKPNGDRHWPLVGFLEYDTIAPIRQYQVIQETLERITVRFVTDEPLSHDQKAAFTRLIQKSLGYEFELEILDQRDDLPRLTNGKFEEFISKVATG